MNLDVKKLKRSDERLVTKINNLAEQLNTLKSEYDELINERNVLLALIRMAEESN